MRPEQFDNLFRCHILHFTGSDIRPEKRLLLKGNNLATIVPNKKVTFLLPPSGGYIFMFQMFVIVVNEQFAFNPIHQGN